MRASQIDDIPWSSYAVDDFILDPPIADRVRQLYGEKPLGWKDSLSDFARLIESHWDNCSNKTRKCLRYARKHWQNATSRNMPAFTSFARLLKKEPWVPVLDIDKACKPSDLVLYNSENKELAGDQTLFSYCRFDNPEIVSFLEINQRPPESTALRRLRVAVTKQVSNLEQFATLYAELANNPGEVTALRQAFVAEPLIFVPTHESKYLTSNQVLYCEKTVLTPYFAAISTIYPALKQFFCDTMAIPSEEQLDHYICFLKEHVWKVQPRMTDNLRSSIESCYRRLFHYLNGAEEEDREQAQANLKNRLGTSPKVFCGALGWVSTSEKTVIYPNTRAYEEFVKNIETVAIESHMKRLSLPLSEIDPLLAVFNIHPLSRAI